MLAPIKGGVTQPQEFSRNTRDSVKRPPS